MKPARSRTISTTRQASADRISPRREISPFRPRSLQSLQSDAVAVAARLRMRRTSAPSDRRPTRGAGRADRASAAGRGEPRELLAAREAAKAEEMALRLAEAYARGREEGRAVGRAEAQDLLAAERAAAAEPGGGGAPRVPAQRIRPARSDDARRASPRSSENVGAAVARILAPFLAKEVVKHAADELCRTSRAFARAARPAS